MQATVSVLWVLAFCLTLRTAHVQHSAVHGCNESMLDRAVCVCVWIQQVVTN